MNRSIHFFHLKVRTLHHTHLHTGATLAHPVTGKSLDALHRIQGFGQIRLENDAARVVLQ